MRLMMIAVLFSVTAVAAAACGVSLKSYDIQTGERELHVDKNAAISQVCLEWYPDTTHSTQVWRCASVRDLRRLLFKDTDIF
jgi:hypothetical protein